jgi:hypothetical protein
MSFSGGTDGSNNNIEEVEIWEPLSIIHKHIDTLIDVTVINIEELEDWEPLRLMPKDTDIPTSEGDTLEEE